MTRNPHTPTQDEYTVPSRLPRRRNLWIWMTCGAIAIVAVSTFFSLEFFGVFSSSQQTRKSTSVVTTQSTPVASTPVVAHAVTLQGTMLDFSTVSVKQGPDVIAQYYADINAQNYQSAYNAWGNQYQQAVPYTTFVQGFANTQKDTLQPGNATALSDGTVNVPVTVTATEALEGATATNVYQGDYIVGLQSGRAKMLTAHLQQTSSSNNRVQQAVTVLSQYYVDINGKNYQDAYNLWGSAYHNATSYQHFTAGFAITESSTITIMFEGITVLTEGSVKIPLMIRAVDANSPGSITHVYYGSYIIGAEGASWQLFSANIQSVFFTKDLVSQAVAVLNQYYADINSKDYQAAYNLWGVVYHQRVSYQLFAAGFARTRSVGITLGSLGMKVLLDGSVEIPLAIHAENATSSGIVTSVYQGYYIIGSENNAWQLFGASIQQQR